MRTDLRMFKPDQWGLRPASSVNLPAGLLSAKFPSSSDQSNDAHVMGRPDYAGHFKTINGHVVQNEIDPQLTDQGVIFGTAEDVLASDGDMLKHSLASNHRLEERLFCCPARCVPPRQHDSLRALAFALQSQFIALLPLMTVVSTHHMYLLSSERLLRLPFLRKPPHVKPLDQELASLRWHRDSRGKRCSPANGKYSELGSRSGHVARQKAVVHENAKLQWTLAALGSRLSQVAQDVALVGKNAEAQVNGVMFTEGKQQLVYNTLQHHEAPSCHSDLLYKGALQDRSRLVQARDDQS